MAKIRYPLLDVLRTSAILLVVLHHFRDLVGAPQWFRWFFLRGYIGVDIFFVLSGYLIGTQALGAIKRNGRLPIRQFLLRRWLRTLPAYYTVMLSMLAAGTIDFHNALIMGLSVQNYLSPAPWLISWSLCIEEHFYLLLPFLALSLLWVTRKGISGKTIVVSLCMLSIVISPVLRGLAFSMNHNRTFDWYIYKLFVRTHFRLDGLAVGVALAAAQLWNTAIWRRLAAHSGLVFWVGLLLLSLPWHPWLTGFGVEKEQRLLFFPAVLQPLSVSLGTALLIVAGVTKRSFLTLKIVGAIFFSELAYTLYLTHMEGLLLVKTLSRSHAVPFFLGLPGALCLAILLAMMLRYLIEIPGLKLRAKLAQSDATEN